MNFDNLQVVWLIVGCFILYFHVLYLITLDNQIHWSQFPEIAKELGLDGEIRRIKFNKKLNSYDIIMSWL